MRKQTLKIRLKTGLVAALAVVAAGCPNPLVQASSPQDGYGSSGYHQYNPGYDHCPAYGVRHYDHEEVIVIAYRAGYSLGYDHGYHHFLNRWGYACDHDYVHQGGLHFYQPYYGSQKFYRKHFLRGFKAGFRVGFHRSRHRTDVYFQYRRRY